MQSIDIPVVDINDSNHEAAQQLLSAASDHGFVYVDNNEAGIDPAMINEVFLLSKNFFDKPVEEKQPAAISSNEPGDNVGWLRQGVEKLDPATQKRPDVKEALNINVPLLKTSRIPSLLLPHADLIAHFQQACQALCLRILKHFAVALSIDADWFVERHDQALDKSGVSGTITRLLYYPSHANTLTKTVSSEDIRAGAHSDYGSLTLLFQLPGQPGLEIKNADGSWSPVPVDPSGFSSQGKPLPILVNIGDLLEDWTRGLLKSTVHRVVFPSEAREAGDRYSVAYFCHPLDDVLLEPVPSPLIEDRRGSEREERSLITAKQHLGRRLAATYSIEKQDS